MSSCKSSMAVMYFQVVESECRRLICSPHAKSHKRGVTTPNCNAFAGFDCFGKSCCDLIFLAQETTLACADLQLYLADLYRGTG